MRHDQVFAEPQLMLGAALYLMTRYQRSPCPAMARAIADHLDRLSRHPGAEDSLRSMCTCLKHDWERVVLKAALRLQGGFVH